MGLIKRSVIEKIIMNGGRVHRMKKFIFCLLMTFLFISNGLSVCASSGVYDWFCVHQKDHRQPKVDCSICFIEKYDGFYIDKEHGDECADKVIYLTFDAGYENGNIAKILDALKDEEVAAAFFILGNMLENETDIVLRMYDEGHLVCNHTFSHKPMVNKAQNEFKEELEKLEQASIEITGKPISKYYRPPQGKFDEDSLKYAKDMGYKTVFWSFAYDDWDNDRQMSAEKAKKKILENIHNGEIMLLHPTSATNAEILGEIIKELKNQGYRFGTLDELR